MIGTIHMMPDSLCAELKPCSATSTCDTGETCVSKFCSSAAAGLPKGLPCKTSKDCSGQLVCATNQELKPTDAAVTDTPADPVAPVCVTCIDDVRATAWQWPPDYTGGGSCL